MMRIDAFNHFFPAGYFKKMSEVGSDLKDIASRARAIKSIHDLDTRLKVVEQFPDYAQILSLPAPTLETLSQGRPEVALELAKVGNDGLAELVAKHPKHFPGFLAQVPLTAGDAGVAEAERAINQLGAAGVQIYTNVGGKPLDRPEFEGFFAAMNKMAKPIWIHPERGASHPDYQDEKKSLYEVWWTFGWPYETSVAMSRLVFSKTLDKYPDLRIIAHHLGAMVPYHEGRVGPGWDLRRGLFRPAQEPQEAPSRLLQAGLQRRHGRVRLARGHRLWPGVLRRRQGGVRLRLPVRS